MSHLQTYVEITEGVLVCECGYRTDVPASRDHDGLVSQPIQTCGGCGRVWWCPSGADCEEHVQKGSYTSPGFTDKLYWRRDRMGLWHCYKCTEGGGYTSLCDRSARSRSGGQQCARPPVQRRCALCDSREIERRHKHESLPESPNWRDHDL